MNAKHLEGNNNALQHREDFVSVGTALILFVKFYLFFKGTHEYKYLEGNYNGSCIEKMEHNVGTALMLEGNYNLM